MVCRGVPAVFNDVALVVDGCVFVWQLPEREALSDYAYGDHREMLAVSAGWVEAINDYCWGRVS